MNEPEFIPDVHAEGYSSNNREDIAKPKAKY